MSELKNVPDDKVAEVVELFRRSGNETIECKKMGPDNWTIKATRP